MVNLKQKEEMPEESLHLADESEQVHRSDVGWGGGEGGEGAESRRGLKLVWIRDRRQTIWRSGSVKNRLTCTLNRAKQQETLNSTRQEEKEEEDEWRMGPKSVSVI